MGAAHQIVVTLIKKSVKIRILKNNDLITAFKGFGTVIGHHNGCPAIHFGRGRLLLKVIYNYL